MICEEAEVIDEEEICKIDSSGHISNKGNNIKKGHRKNLSELRTPRQKFCPRWQQQFPWLKPDRIDESVGLCTICGKELVCKKSHLERHQKSFRHLRLQGFENVCAINVSETELIGAHTSGYMDSESEFQDERLMGDESLEYATVTAEPIAVVQRESESLSREQLSTKSVSQSSLTTLPTIKRLRWEPSALSVQPPEKKIEHERDMLVHKSKSRAVTNVLPVKDSFDLFFESVSASVKALPPKLGAEIKSQVSQLLAKFELRAICEKEAQEKANAKSAALTNEETVSSVMQTIPANNELPYIIAQPQNATEQAIAHYVYAYQTK